MSADRISLFSFDGVPVRGAIVQLSESFTAIASAKRYSPDIVQLLGEMLSAVALLSHLFKNADLILQARGSKQLRVIMGECRNHCDLRGIARFNAERMEVVKTQTMAAAEVASISELLGSGDLAMTVVPQQGERYQGLVPLEAESLAGCIERYFESSEQLATRLWLSAQGNVAAGLLLQRIPQPPEQSEISEALADRAWREVTELAMSLTAEDLRRQPPENLLQSLFWPHAIRLTAVTELVARCTCSSERGLTVLQMLGRAEVEDTLAQEGSIEMHCEFCGARYAYDRADLSSILGGP